MKTVINSARAAYFAGVGAVVATLAFAKDQFEPVHATVAVAVGALTGFLFALLLARLAPARLPEVSAATPTHEATPQPNVLSH